MTNENLKMDKYGRLIESTEVEERCLYNLAEDQKAFLIRESCAKAIEIVLEGYNPLQGLPDLKAPEKQKPSELIAFAQFADINDELNVEEVIKILSESEKEYDAAFSEYKKELRHRRYLLDNFEFAREYILSSIMKGCYKNALHKTRKEIKGSYKAEISNIIIKALTDEAPIMRTAEVRHWRRSKIRNAGNMIGEGVRTLLNI